jgi:sec-independent protein translocase protein TatC
VVSVIGVPRRRRAKNPEGRMPLRAHLAELRRRVLISGVAIIIGTVVGWWLYTPVMQNLIIEPLNEASAGGQKVTLTYRAIADAFSIKVRVSVYLGFIVSSPVWLYQVWGFITPGLTRRERRYSMGFVAAAVPLFLAGVALAVVVFPKAAAFGADFALEGSLNQPDASGVVTFAFRLVIALGVAFLLPLFLIALNMVGLISGRALGSHWRVAVFVAFLFAAIVSPSPEPSQMVIMALPLVGLYAVSVFVCLGVDRRRRRRREREEAEAAAELPSVEAIDRPEPLERPEAVEDGAEPRP